MKTIRLAISVALTLATTTLTSIASAQPAAAPQHAEAVAAPPAEDADDEVFTLQLGGTLNYGNTRSVQLAGATHFLLHRDMHVFTLDLAFTFGMAALRDTTTRQFGELTENTRNILGRMRYDLFLDADDALFVSIGGRHDTFAGLDFRFSGQLGYLRNFFREGEGDTHRFWGEIGFDVTVDDRFPNPLPNPAVVTPGVCDSEALPMPGMPPCTLANIDDQYSVRLYVGYDNHMNESWTLRMGLEALFDVVHGDNVRLNSINEVLLRIDGALQAGLRFTLLFDNVPVPGNDPVDTQTVLTLQYTML